MRGAIAALLAGRLFNIAEKVSSQAKAATCTLTLTQRLDYAAHTALQCLVVHMSVTGRRSKSLQPDHYETPSCGRCMYTDTE